VTASPNQVVRVDPTGGAVTVNLPGAGAPVDVAQGQTVIVKNVSASVNAITIDASGLNLIDGATTLVLTAAFASRVLAAQDSVGNWNVVNRFA
jgi:5-enolpyruvylshikimate-3-phosphate synthase